MPTIPIRTLGKIGVITDVNAADLPPEAVTDARNVRFSNGSITNAHVWREALASPSGGTPVFMFSSSKVNDIDIMGYITSDGKVYHVYNGEAADMTPTAYTPAVTEATRTFCYLQGVYYVNQEDRVPWYKTANDDSITYAAWGGETYVTKGSMTYAATLSGATQYANLPNWSANDRCKVLRAYKDFLVALNVTKTGVAKPNLVKWSNTALYGSVPDSWDPADLTKSAGENTLGEIQTDILDGMTLRNSFIIYAHDQAWVMEYTAGPEVFQFAKLFGGRGIVNTNCVVEVDGAHFVFDANDIYMHDGVSPPKSVCSGRVRNKIFRNIDLTKSEAFFVHHAKATSELLFCFNSKASGLKWQGADCTYCNVAAVYNYDSDTWTFHDLPNVTGMSSVAWQTVTEYAGAAALTYDGAGSSYVDLLPNDIHNTFATSVAEGDVATTRIVQMDTGLTPALPFEHVAELAVTPFVERLGLDLDEVLPELRAYKNYRAIYPQVTADDATAPFSFKFGGVDMPTQEVEWDTLQTFEPTSDYKIDTRSRGRYLSWYFEGDNTNTYSLSGFDLDVVSVSRR